MNITALLFGQLGYLMTFFASHFMQNDLTEMLQTSNPVERYGLPVEEVFDFIIVGAGTAGCLVANKLSREYRVLLLEMGGDPAPQGQVPYFAVNYIPIDEYVYTYPSIPQTHAAQQYGGIVTAQTGKVMGGSSSINFGIFSHGHPLDFDYWANVTQDSSWNYTNFLHHFKNIEDYSGEFPSSDYHGTNGSVGVAAASYAPGANVWYDAGRELGYPANVDPNGPQTEGFMPYEYSKKDGRRSSSYTAYILNQTLQNLEIRRYSNVQEILINEENITAYGVRYTHHGFPKIAIATHEVIVSAGVFGSPQLLLRSGIGPQDELAESNIRTIVNLPGVGKNLQIHASLRLGIIINSTDPSLVHIPARDLTYESIDEFLLNGTGVLTVGGFAAGQGFTTSSVAAQEGYPNWPDLQYVLITTGETVNQTEQYITMSILGARPKSSGFIRLNPNNTDGPPLIDYGLLTDDRDVVTFIDGIRFILRLVEETNAYARIGARYPNTPAEPCAHLSFRTEEYWRCYLLNYATGVNHQTSTYRMGRNGIDNAVVDSQLRVFGVTNLRVIDGSIMPTITNTNVQAPIYAIADKISDQILNDLRRIK